MTCNALDVRELSKWYGRNLFRNSATICALDNLSISFEARKVTALLGHNGAGKTTLIKTILGLTHSGTGTVHFFGHPMSRNARQLIGYMPENTPGIGNMNAYALLTCQARLYGKGGKDIINRALQSAGLSAVARRPTGEFSKGMGRRLAWALATIHDPDLLILDEPFSGLDPQGRNQLDGWIQEFKSNGKTIIICSHEIQHCLKLADSYRILQSGKLIKSGTNQDQLFAELISENPLTLQYFARSS